MTTWKICLQALLHLPPRQPPRRRSAGSGLGPRDRTVRLVDVEALASLSHALLDHDPSAVGDERRRAAREEGDEVVVRQVDKDPLRPHRRVPRARRGREALEGCLVEGSDAVRRQLTPRDVEEAAIGLEELHGGEARQQDAFCDAADAGAAVERGAVGELRVGAQRVDKGERSPDVAVVHLAKAAQHAAHVGPDAAPVAPRRVVPPRRRVRRPHLLRAAVRARLAVLAGDVPAPGDAAVGGGVALLLGERIRQQREPELVVVAADPRGRALTARRQEVGPRGIDGAAARGTDPRRRRRARPAHARHLAGGATPQRPCAT